MDEGSAPKQKIAILGRLVEAIALHSSAPLVRSNECMLANLAAYLLGGQSQNLRD